MSKLICSAAIRGAYKHVARAQGKLDEMIEAKGADQKVELPNTGYYLPIIYSMTGIAIKTLGQMREALTQAKELLPPVPEKKLWVPYLGHALDAGMATLWAEEIFEACKYLDDPVPYTMTEAPLDGRIWLGAADDKIMRERGIEFVDGSAPGFAACVGACQTTEQAVKLARQLQEKRLYVFMAGHTNGKTMAEQLAEGGVQMGWDTRLIPFGKDISAAIFALGFASRAALSFGGVQPGDYARNLRYNKNRIFAFVLALGEVDDEKYATAAGAINYGFPTIAETEIPEVLPTGICTYEHVVSSVPVEDMVERAISVRGLKIKITHIPIPVPYSPAFEGERIRKEDMHCEMGGQRTPAFEFCTMLDMEQVKDGRVEVFGPDLADVKEGGRLPLAIWIEVAGRKMQPDFEPILERQVHRFLNEAQGIFHMGQRDTIWVRVSKQAKVAGLKLEHFGTILHAMLHEQYSAIVDRIQVKIYTEEKKILELRDAARKVFKERDDRLAGMTDESVETFYSCTLCQSFAPNHVCVITPERSGLCGAYNWLDGRAAFEINPTGPNQPIEKGRAVEAKLGQWDKVNEFVAGKSNRAIERFSAYSMIKDPMTSCGCFEAISAILPSTNGIMIVDRDYPEMTPCGMKFSTLAGTVGGGQQTPGFVGHSRQYIVSPKFISGDGGLARVVWMPKKLKETLGDSLTHRAKDAGLGEDFADKIADETVATSEEEVLAYLTQKGHPALAMESMF